MMEYCEEDLEEVRQSRLLINRFDDWLFDEFQGHVGARVLEIGCGVGNHLRHFLDRELVVGIDVSENSITAVRKNFSDHPNVRAEMLSITDDKVVDLRDEQFDTAVSVNVFEHIERDGVGFSNTWSILDEDGVFVLVVPAHSWLYGAMDRSIGHFRRYTKESVAAKLRTAGFRIVIQKYINSVGALGWFVNGKVLCCRVPPRGQLRVLNAIVPFVRKFERVIRMPFGVSLLTIAKKCGRDDVSQKWLDQAELGRTAIPRQGWREPEGEGSRRAKSWDSDTGR